MRLAVLARRLTRFLPRSLLWRTFVLLALLILASVAAWFQIYTFHEQMPRAKSAAQLVASVVNLTRAALVNADPEKRLALIIDISELEGIRLYPVEEPEKLIPMPTGGMFGHIAPELKRLLGPETRVAMARNGQNGLWVSFFIDDDEYWVVMQRDRFDRILPGEWLGWGVVTLLFSLLGAYLIVLGVARPLKRLALAARAVGRGEMPPPLPERGAAEIATVAHAFNQMNRDLAQLDADRALILAGISHDLRTPLARMRLGIEMMGDDPMRDGMVEDIEDMDRVIGQFLDFARETGGEDMGETDLAALMLDVAEGYGRRNLPVRFQVDKAPAGPALTRPPALRRALANLIENALRYAGKELPIDMVLSQEGDVFWLDVRDQGPGIPEDQVERVKRPFARLESARSNATGAGLGLAIVDRIARSHGGELQLLTRQNVDGVTGLAARLVLPFPPRAGLPSPGAPQENRA